MCEDWWHAYDLDNKLVSNPVRSFNRLKKMTIIWKIQKIGEIEPLTYLKDDDNSSFCIACVAVNMIKCTHALQQPKHLHLASIGVQKAKHATLQQKH